MLGTLLQLDHAIQHRKWVPFNALRKPERTVLNMLPLDVEHRSHFQHLGDNLWRFGDLYPQGTPKRPNDMDDARQPLSITIKQQDVDSWWVLLDVGEEECPAPWMRRFSAALRRSVYDFLFNPLALARRPFPDFMWF